MAGIEGRVLRRERSMSVYSDGSSDSDEGHGGPSERRHRIHDANSSSEHFEDLKRATLITKRPGETDEEAKRSLYADLEEHDRLNISLTTTYSNFVRGDHKPHGWHDVPAGTSPSRVVFMFLVMDKLKNEAWWEKWFEQADAAGHMNHYSIVYHRGAACGKDSDIIMDDLLARKGMPAWPPTKTGWARSGLVRATLLLLRFALEETENQWFVLLSDTCMPVYCFHDLYNILQGETQSRFRDFGLTIDIAMQRNIWQNGCCTSERCSHKADQWAMWVRADAEWFVKENHLLRVRPLATFIDEPYFINMMDEHHRPYRNVGTTYTRWYKLSPALIEQGVNKFVTSPFTFQKVSMRRIGRARRRDCWFLRKVTAGAEFPSPEDLKLAPETALSRLTKVFRVSFLNFGRRGNSMCAQCYMCILRTFRFIGGRRALN
eukprot:TRINITY_DN27834_c0_g1_i1.p1 TRINITY_DN27834_c0_g1~~TRINITY_DN27834_c0_g1_i1.p1  ORF type:complete len:432 (+),score=62.31 TRINITY_DN27834_c0_g1_i1:111-1406(+)